jgi:uncharacterized protein
MEEFSLLGFEFSPLELSHRPFLTDFLRRYPQPLTGYTFSTLAAWTALFHYQWVLVEPETLLLSCVLNADPNRQLLQPVGSFPVSARQQLLREAVALPYALKMIGVGDVFVKQHPDFCQSFSVAEDRAVSNYVYKASDLAQLPGRKYSKKRNLLAQASGLYEWSAKILTPERAPACFAILRSIAEEERPVIEGMLARELAALECTLNHFHEFEQQGLIIYVNDRPVAFSIYEPISPTTVAIHFERALRSYKGLYQVINLESAKAIEARGFDFINREEDLGDPGLRDAKLSYHPAEIVPAYELVFNKAH